jgi:hypothetical protein
MSFSGNPESLYLIWLDQMKGMMEDCW